MKKVSSVPTTIGCIAVQLCVGILYIWSVFRNPVVEFYSWSAQASQMVASYMLFAFSVGGLIGGFLQDRMDPKKVTIIGVVMFCAGVFATSLLNAATIELIYLTYCAVAGLGCGIAYGSVLACMQKWFPHRRGFASGLAVSAFGLSTVVFSPVCSALLERFSVPVTFRLLAGVFFVLSLLACLLIKLPPEEYIKSLNLQTGAGSTQRSYKPGEAVKTLPFWCIFIASFLMNGVYNITGPMIKPLGMERGLTDSMATLAVSLTGITNVVGRLGVATISDKVGRVPSMIMMALINAACAFLLIFVGGVPYIVVIAVLALAYGAPSSIMPAMCTDTYGTKYAGTNYGFILLSLGLSSVFFNNLAKLINNQTTSFIIVGCCTLLPVVFMLIFKKSAAKLKEREG